MIARVLICTLALALGAASPAFGHSVMKRENGVVHYTANDDLSANQLRVSISGDNLRFFDPAADGGITPANGCNAGQVNSQGFVIEVNCPRAGTTLVRIDVGEAADRVSYEPNDVPSLIIGGAGADDITGGALTDTVNGDDGNDTIRTGGGNDAVVGGEGDDTLDLGDGDDSAQGGLGADRIATGGGNDTIRVRDNVADEVGCADGSDTVEADGADVLTGCETVDRGTATGADAGGQPAPGPGGGPSSGPPSTSTASDRTPPRLRAGGSTRQRLGGRTSVLLLATVSEAAQVSALGFVTVGGSRYPLRERRAGVTVGGAGVELRLAMDAKTRRAVRRALRRKRRVTVTTTILATDRAGNSSSTKLPSIVLI